MVRWGCDPRSRSGTGPLGVYYEYCGVCVEVESMTESKGLFKEQIKWALESTVLWMDLKDDDTTPEKELGKIV